MSKQQLGVAIVGCGMIGKFHLKAIKDVPELKVIGVCGSTANSCISVASEWGVRNFGSFEEILDDPAVDIVDICLPSGMHAEFGCKAAEAGKNIVVEKPIDVTLEAAQHLVDTCRKSGVALAVILQNRFSPSVQKVKKALDENVLGRLLFGEGTIKWYRPESYYTSSRWKGTRKYDGGGALMNQGIHTIDLLLWFMGGVKNVKSFVRTSLHPIEVEDLATAIVEFESGALGTVTGSTAMKPGFPERIELYGEKGSIALEAGRIVRWAVDGMQEEDYLDRVPRGSGSSDPGGIPVENHRAQFESIARAILAGKQPPVSGEEAIRPMRFILDIYAADKEC